MKKWVKGLFIAIGGVLIAVVAFLLGKKSR
jgi:hypothetical protein